MCSKIYSKNKALYQFIKNKEPHSFNIMIVIRMDEIKIQYSLNKYEKYFY